MDAAITRMATIWNINTLTFMLPALTRSKSDIFHIHSYLYLTSNQAILAKIMNKRSALLHLHGGVGVPPYKVSRSKLAAKHFYDRSLGKFTIKNSDLIASVSKSDLEAISNQFNIGKKRLHYVPNMVDTDLFKPHVEGPSKNNTLLYLGDLEPWKGVGSLIKWIRKMNETHSQEVAIRFVGQGSYMQNLLNLEENLRKSDNGLSLEILGPKKHEEIPHILQNSSALILPSYWEGMPTVLLEAMACGVPTISTRVGDVPRLIEHGKTGFLIDRSFHSFRNAIDSVLDNNSHVRSIIHHARELVEREFSLINTERIVKDIYCEIAS